MVVRRVVQAGVGRLADRQGTDGRARERRRPAPLGRRLRRPGRSVTPVPRFDTGAVRQYYDRHTARFLSWGQGGSVGAIHRAVWGPGVATREQAFRYVEDRIADQLPALASPDGSVTVIDLGCGVGATLCSLAERLPALRGLGVTLSPVQAQEAQARVERQGLVDRVRCIEGDFCDLSLDLSVPAPDRHPRVDLIYAIESFVHGTNPAFFFIQCARRLRPGGRVIICDDMLRPDGHAPGARRAIERFQRGWRINTLIDREELRKLAGGGGFAHESTIDLTPHLELRRPRDRGITFLANVARWLPLDGPLGHLTGGAALGRCLQRGWIAYDLAHFRRRDD
ncbi:MAG: methyltransferase domain-containing protein [Acidobacteria bacterium]|nr:methyltransferase domain-containing protein [Acidobacteriota bacterium]